VGLALGLVGAWATARFLRHALFGVTVTDWPSYAVPVGFLLAATLAASVAPAWRAARVDPVKALRHD
jgi:ABC-type antimicrobial peptide transport system permease subunit